MGTRNCIALIVVTGCFIVPGCLFDDGGEPERQVIVEAADGSATLRIPGGALPESVDPSTIALVPDHAGVSSEDGTVRAWRLEPDGLELSIAAELTLRGEGERAEKVIVDHHTDSEVERLVTSLTFDAAGGLESTVVMIEHFSAIVFMNARAGGTIEWVREPRDLVFGETMTVSVSLTIPDYRATYTYDGRTTELIDSDPVMWGHSTELVPSSVLRPDARAFSFEPIGTRMETLEGDFTCEAPGGEYTIEARTDIDIAVQGIVTTSDGTEYPVTLKEGMRAGGRGELQSATYNCAAGLDCTSGVKEEYTTARMELGEDRVETIATPGSGGTDLDSSGGTHGFYIMVEPGQTITVTVSAGSPVSLMYFPHRSPGFEYTDTTPGTTEIRNVSAECANAVLLVADGAGMVSITVAAD